MENAHNSGQDILYLSVLPMHPPPERGESFTGYLTRFGYDNGLPETYTLCRLLGLSYDLAGQTNECPPTRWGKLPVLANCSEDDLLATTLHYLGAKFGRTSHLAGAARFLTGVLSTYVRYCPYCLAARKDPWYSLSWRFLTLTGCPVHGCRLLEECYRCGSEVTPLSSPLCIFRCPACEADLREGAAAPIPEKEIESAARHTEDISFLVSCEPALYKGQFTPTGLGSWLADCRQILGISQRRLAELLRVSVGQIGAVERGDTSVGPSFLAYLAYADFLGVTLKEAFVASCSPSATPAPREPDLVLSVSVHTHRHEHPSAEAIMMEQVLRSIEVLRAHNTQVTQTTIIRETGITRARLERYQQVRAILDEVKAEGRRVQAETFRLREAALLCEVEQAISDLRVQGHLISQTKVSRKLGVYISQLNYYPRVRRALRDAAEGPGGVGKGRNGKDTGVPKGTSEIEVLAQVKRAIESLRRRGKPLSLNAITKWINIPARQLKQYEKVCRVLEDFKKEVNASKSANIQQNRAVREDAILHRVIEAQRALDRQHIKVTQLSLSEHVGLSTTTLMYYPRIAALLDTIDGKRRDSIKAERLSAEDRLLVGIEEACTALSEMGVLPTHHALEEWLGISRGALSRCRYERVRSWLAELKCQLHEEQVKHSRERQTRIVARAVRAVATLEHRSEPVTYCAVEHVLGRPLYRLRYHPRVRKAVLGSANNPHRARLAFVEREVA